MWLILDHFSRVLIDAAVANAILLSVVVVAVVLTRQPARRVVLAEAGIYAALLMVPLVALNPSLRAYPVDWLLGTGLIPPPLTPDPDRSGAFGPAIPGANGRVAPRGRAPSSRAEWPSGERLVRVGTLLYLAGAATGLAWFGLGLWGFRRMLARSAEAGPEARRVFEELIVDLERSPPQPDLRVSPWLRSPVLGGVARPTIILPAEVEEPDVDRDALRLILLHELAHADRGDALFNALAALAQILWFFLPHLWWLRAQLRIDQEFLADRKAAGPLGESTHYARWLVGLSSGRPGRGDARRKVDPGGSGAHRPWDGRGFDTPLLQRIAMLLYCPFVVEEHPPRWFSAIVTAGVVVAAAGLSTLRFLAPVDPSVLRHEAQPRDPVVRSFPVPEFIVVPVRPTADQPDPAYSLLLPLPPAFSLRAEVYASPRALAQLRIAGCPLVPEAEARALLDDPEASAGPPIRHYYTLRHEYGSLKASIDGREFELDPKILDDARWLTITPALDETATIRNLLVNW